MNGNMDEDIEATRRSGKAASPIPGFLDFRHILFWKYLPLYIDLY
jgi:hypothetical protein